MDDENDLTTRRTILAETEAKIAAEMLQFEQSIAPLRQHAEQLRQEYIEALRAELARVEHRGAKPDLAKILAAIERNHHPIIVERMRDLAAKYKAGRHIQES